MKHSQRYQKIKKKIVQDKSYSLDESLSFLQNNNLEKLKNIKVSFTLNWDIQKQKIPFRVKIIFPCSWSTKGKIAVIKDNLPVKVVSNLEKNKVVELLSVEEAHHRIMNETRDEFKRRSQWGFEKLVVPPQNEKNFKEKIPPKLYGLIARKRRVLLNENVEEEVEKFQQGEREIKTDKSGNIQALIGKSDFSQEQLAENYQAIYQKINGWRPPKWKGALLKKITVSTAMGPGLKISL